MINFYFKPQLVEIYVLNSRSSKTKRLNYYIFLFLHEKCFKYVSGSEINKNMLKFNKSIVFINCQRHFIAAQKLCPYAILLYFEKTAPESGGTFYISLLLDYS